MSAVPTHSECVSHAYIRKFIDAIKKCISCLYSGHSSRSWKNILRHRLHRGHISLRCAANISNIANDSPLTTSLETWADPAAEFIYIWNCAVSELYTCVQVFDAQREESFFRTTTITTATGNRIRRCLQWCGCGVVVVMSQNSVCGSERGVGCVWIVSIIICVGSMRAW